MVHDDPRLQNCMQPIVDAWYKGVVEKGTLNELYNAVVENPIFIDARKKVETCVDYANLGLGAFSIYSLYAGGYYKWNNIWHKTKTSGTAFCWESRWSKNFSVQHRLNDISGVSKYRNIADKVNKGGGGVLLLADIAASGEIKVSHGINLAVTLASGTVIGGVVAVVWFAADYGTMGINLLISGEAKSLGDIIDEKLSDYCYKLPF